jgi:hypothetical protein
MSMRTKARIRSALSLLALLAIGLAVQAGKRWPG